MRRLYERVASRRGDGKAMVRVTNKMAIIIWHMLTERRPYQQAKEELYRSKLKRMARIAG
jgi:Lon protease-like protein